MNDFAEKRTIRITDNGVLITDPEGNALKFTAGEALMLLDILTNEATRLRDMAQEASPFPVKVHV
jgi:hypothetical protein